MGGGQNLDSLLIMPIQRIPRYILLFETLLKHTDPSYKDYEGLQNALNMVKEVAGHVNSAHAEVDNAMFTLCCRFGEDFEELMEPWRTCADEIVLKIVGSKKNDRQLMILLSDYIVLASAHKKPKWKGKIQLAKCWIIDTADTEEHQNLFTLYCPLDSIKVTYSCSSAEEKKTWVDKIRIQITKTIEDQRLPNQELRQTSFDSRKLSAQKGS